MITSAEVLQIEERRRAAMAAGDAAALEALSHDDLVYVHGSAASIPSKAGSRPSGPAAHAIGT